MGRQKLPKAAIDEIVERIASRVVAQLLQESAEPTPESGVELGSDNGAEDGEGPSKIVRGYRVRTRVTTVRHQEHSAERQRLARILARSIHRVAAQGTEPIEPGE